MCIYIEREIYIICGYISIYIYIYTHTYIYIYIYVIRILFEKYGARLPGALPRGRTSASRCWAPALTLRITMCYDRCDNDKCVCVCLSLSLSLSLYIYIYIHTHMYNMTSLYIYIYIYTHTHLYMLLYVCMYIYIYITYVYMRTSASRCWAPSLTLGILHIGSWMEKPTRSDSYPNPLRLAECLLSLTESY